MTLTPSYWEAGPGRPLTVLSRIERGVASGSGSPLPSYVGGAGRRPRVVIISREP
ncbi:hypothetical protein [Streptomyces sp. NPDC006645]|uniref:hypothetical protein n=1 Tax=Streptomyces sp. NPDC006645 TaxID=3157184 RepID=UPI0033A2FD10